MSIREIIERERDLDKTEVLYIVSYALREKKEQIVARLDAEIDPSMVETVLKLIAERKKGKPFAYIAGKKEFFSHEFLVDESVLIPRPETELIVEEAEKLIEKKRPRRIMDMGTGSGAIGITLAIRTSLPVYCVDISKEALFTAKKNARLHGVEKKVFFVCSDLFSAITAKEKFDLILANLPYVDERDLGNLPQEVRNYEPLLALDGGKGGLELIKRFLEKIESYMAEDGTLLLEIGGKNQADYVKSMLLNKGFQVEILKDYSNSERIVRATWKNLS